MTSLSSLLLPAFRRAARSVLRLAPLALYSSTAHGQAPSTKASGTAAEAGAAPIVRKGFTLELGTGAAYAFQSGGPRQYDHNPQIEYAPFSFSLGGFLTRDFSLLFRLTSIASGDNDRTSSSGVQGSERLTFVSVGAAAQYFLSDRFFLGGGVAQGELITSRTMADGSSLQSAPRGGFVITARAGYAFLVLDHHAFSLVAELTPGFFGETTFIGNTLQAQWQYYLP